MRAFTLLGVGAICLGLGVWPAQYPAGLSARAAAAVRGGSCDNRSCSQWTCFFASNQIKKYLPYTAKDIFFTHSMVTGGHVMAEQNKSCTMYSCESATEDCGGTPESACTNPEYCTIEDANHARYCCANGNGEDEKCIQSADRLAGLSF
jgi:hypothetical protein